jgi:hypothetical protein
MGSYFGNSVTLSADGASVGSIKTITVPPREHARVDFTVLGDTVQQMHLSPVMDAGELEFTVLLDSSVAAQKAIYDDVGSLFRGRQIILILFLVRFTATKFLRLLRAMLWRSLSK